MVKARQAQPPLCEECGHPAYLHTGRTRSCLGTAGRCRCTSFLYKAGVEYKIRQCPLP